MQKIPGWPKALAVAALVFIVAFMVAYIVIATGQNNGGVAWGYVAVLAAAALLALSAGLTGRIKHSCCPVWRSR